MRLRPRRVPPATAAPAAGSDSTEPDPTEPDPTEPDGTADPDDAPDRRGVRAPRTRAQRVYLALFATVAGLFVVSLLWIVVTGLVARAQLTAVKGELKQLRGAVTGGHITQARQLSNRIAEQTASAHQLTSGPAWWVGSNIPALGTPLRTGRVVALQADRVGHRALPGVVDLAADVVGAERPNGALELTAVQHSSGRLDSAARVLADASRRIAATDPSWLALVSGPRRDAARQLHTLSGQLGDADRAVDTLLPMLGADRPQRYFVGFMNEAEARSLGGLPGAFAILTVNDGRLTFTHFGSDDELLGVRARIPTSAEFRALYGQNDPTGDIRNSDLSPNFPDAARIWAGLWQARTGQHVDGAIALDPSAIGYLLAETGPATLPDGSQVTAANVVALTQQKQYTLYGGSSDADKTARKKFLITVASAVSRKTFGAPSLRPLATAALRAVRERRLVVWSADAHREQVITGFGLGGVLDAKGKPFAAFFLNNATGGKMDFYVSSRISYRRSSCAAGAATTASLTLTNNTPPYPLPPYVTYVATGRPAGAEPGFTRYLVAYYATPGAQLTDVTLDGRRQILATAPEGGLVTVRLVVDLPAGATRTLTVTTVEPHATGRVQIVRQPAVRSAVLSVDAPSCS